MKDNQHVKYNFVKFERPPKSKGIKTVSIAIRRAKIAAAKEILERIKDEPLQEESIILEYIAELERYKDVTDELADSQNGEGRNK